MSNYAALIQRLFQVNLFGGVKLGLANSLRLQTLLNFPDRHYASIHVAGTNGKGSVATKIAYGLQAAGYRVGLYTSPHLACFRERIRIDGEMIPEHNVEVILSQLFEITAKEDIPATFFELTTFLALIYFAQQKVDYAVLETGLGGRMDATNIVNPILSVITSISLEHTEILGPTLEAITREKAGIIKPQVPVIIGPHVPLDIIQVEASKYNSPYIQVQARFSSFEDENCAIALTALEQLSSTLHLPFEAIKKGLAARPPCRFEIFYNPSPVILDVAHNPDGLERLFERVQKQFSGIENLIFFGLSKNKDVASCLEILAQQAATFYPVEAMNGRGVSKQDLKAGLISLGICETQIHLFPSIQNSFQQALKNAQATGQLVVVCGTFFIMAEVREALGLNEARDSIELNERMKSQG